MQTLPTFIWQAPHETARWYSANNAPVPKELHFADDTLTANQAYRWITQNQSILWQGDYQNGRQILRALHSRIDKRPPPKNTPMTPLEYFHQHRLLQSQRAQFINRLLVKLEPKGKLNLRRAPDVAIACQELFGVMDEAIILPLQTLLGILGAHEWHKKGVEIKELDATFHVPYSVFSPLRSEYLELLSKAEFPTVCETAIDVGTGSGVIAALLAKRGVKKVVGTDTNAKAIEAARANIERMGYSSVVELRETNLIPADATADLIVCNPPWLPANPTSVIEEAIYDPKSQMLRAFLREAPKHLNEGGEIWLIMSNLAENLGLRKDGELAKLFTDQHLEIKKQLKIVPKHTKAQETSDPLYEARKREVTSLYQLGKTA